MPLAYTRTPIGGILHSLSSLAYDQVGPVPYVVVAFLTLGLLLAAVCALDVLAAEDSDRLVGINGDSTSLHPVSDAAGWRKMLITEQIELLILMTAASSRQVPEFAEKIR